MIRKGVQPLMPPVPREGLATSPCAACAVRDLSVCGALEPSDMERLNAIVSHQTLDPGETLLMEGDPAAHLFVMTAGCVKLYKMLADGRRQITGFLYPSDFLGLAFRNRYAFSAEAVAPSSVCRFPKAKLEALLDEFPAMERRLLGIAAHELAAAQDQMLLLGRKTAEEKLASFLWLLGERNRAKGEDATRIDLPMTRTDIGDFLGLTIETVSRSVSLLKKRGVLASTTPQRLRIVDPDALADLAGMGAPVDS